MKMIWVKLITIEHPTWPLCTRTPFYWTPIPITLQESGIALHVDVELGDPADDRRYLREKFSFEFDFIGLTRLGADFDRAPDSFGWERFSVEVEWRSLVLRTSSGDRDILQKHAAHFGC